MYTQYNVQGAEAAELHVGSIVLTNRITDNLLMLLTMVKTTSHAAAATV